MSYLEEKPIRRNLRCPHCHCDDLAFVTEYHKADLARFLRFLVRVALFFFICLFLLHIATILGKNTTQTFFSLFSSNVITEQIQFGSYVPFIIIFGLISFLLSSYITYTERRTHVQAICRVCGELWLLN